MLGERKNVNLPGVVVDLPTSTEKDKEDIIKWGIPNKIDMIALSFVRKGSDLVEVRKFLWKACKNILLMLKVGMNRSSRRKCLQLKLLKAQEAQGCVDYLFLCTYYVKIMH